MTDLVDEIRADIQKDIFDVLGKTTTLINKTTPIYNSRGEKISSTSVQSTIISVPYNIIWNRNSPQPFGQFNQGDMALFVPYDTSVAIDDLIVLENNTFKVSEIQYHYIPDNVATLLRISRVPDMATPELIPTT